MPTWSALLSRAWRLCTPLMQRRRSCATLFVKLILHNLLAETTAFVGMWPLQGQRPGVWIGRRAAHAAAHQPALRPALDTRAAGTAARAVGELRRPAVRNTPAEVGAWARHLGSSGTSLRPVASTRRHRHAPECLGGPEQKQQQQERRQQAQQARSPMRQLVDLLNSIAGSAASRQSSLPAAGSSRGGTCRRASSSPMLTTAGAAAAPPPLSAELAARHPALRAAEAALEAKLENGAGGRFVRSGWIMGWDDGSVKMQHLYRAAHSAQSALP